MRPLPLWWEGPHKRGGLIRRSLTREVAFGGRSLTREVAFGGRGLTRELTFGGRSLTREVAFGGRSLTREGTTVHVLYRNLFY